MITTRSTTKKQNQVHVALAASAMGRLAHLGAASPLLTLIVAEIPANDAFCVQLTCKPLHALIKERFAFTGGVKTENAGVVSSVARFEWIVGLPEAGDQPAWIGRLEKERVFEYGCHPRWQTEAAEKIARCGGLEVLKHVRQQGCDWNASTCEAAAYGGHLECLKWARENGCPWGEDTCDAAAYGGHLECLQWMRVNGCEWTEETCTIAAQYGQLQVLQWARADGCPWDEYTCSGAAGGYGGCHFECLKWLRANGCPWDGQTCHTLARSGHLEVLKWAKANGCPWGIGTLGAAAYGGHLEVLKWATANGCPWNYSHTISACYIEDAEGDQKVIRRWIKANRPAMGYYEPMSSSDSESE